jgi:hypothetical protein
MNDLNPHQFLPFSGPQRSGRKRSCRMPPSLQLARKGRVHPIMPSELMRVSPHELLILQALAGGRLPPITSNHRTRLELLGLVRDGPSGLQLTPEGHRRARQKAPAMVEPEKFDRSREQDSAPRDARGRRKRGRHTLPI